MNYRLAVLFLSIGTIVAYGYALGGLMGYLLGEGKPLVIAGGLVSGTFCALAAFKLWGIYLSQIDEEIRKDEREETDEEDQ